MAEFTIEIAGVPAAVTCLFDSTKDYCRRYLTEKTPCFSVTVGRADLEYEQQELLEEALREGFRVRKFTDPFLERAAIQRQIAENLVERGVLLLHGSTVAVDGQGYLFAARSGTGKSTHTRNWMQLFANRAQMVNDDKPFLKFTAGGVFACGAPWSGKHGLDSNITVPLKGICLLERGAENRIRRASPEELLPLLLHESCPPRQEWRQAAYRALVQELSTAVPLWRMECTKDLHAAQVAYEAMAHA